MQHAYPLTAADRVLQKTPYSFDVSVWEFFWPLLTGARLVVARPDGHRDPAYLAALIQAQGITVAHFVPSMLRAFLAEPASARCAGVHHLICSGEALPPALQAECFARVPGVALHNLYGPTEASVDVTAWTCRRDAPPDRSVPIGTPIANTQLYVLDTNRRLVPVGVAGELYIGGVGVGRGYLNRPELTAERFVADPFQADPKARLYRTGDLACVTAAGVFEYLGRLDFQVKLRGYRIELGEIEAALQTVPGVAQAIVIKREDAPGDERLVGYLVANGASPLPDPSQIQTRLRAKLPDFMVPSAFVTLDAMPLTASGKLNRRALPAPSLAGDEARQHEPPATGTERVLAGIWQEVLAVTDIGRTDDFFALGGHSLRATQVASRLRKTFGIELPLRTLFEARTLAGLAERVDAIVGGTATGLVTRRIEPRAFDGPAPLSFTQERMWLIHSLAPENSAYNMPIGQRLRGPLDVRALESAFNELRRRHETLRSTFVMIDGEPRQEVAPLGPGVACRRRPEEPEGRRPGRGRRSGGGRCWRSVRSRARPRDPEYALPHWR